MIRPQPMLVLDDVEAGSRWFCDVLGVSSGHGGAEYEMLMDGDELVAQLHLWDAHEHPHLGNPADPSRGNGVLLWFTTDDFDAVVERAASSGTEVLEPAAYNPNAQQREIWLRGPEGYTVVVASLREPPPS
jgi:extradiol dioxygenase family protein